jgi:hypothetical protein
MLSSILIPLAVIVVVAGALLLLNQGEFRSVFRKQNLRRPRDK